jgi:hypothetical protein
VTPVIGYTKHFRYTAGSGSPYTGPTPGVPCFAGLVTVWTAIQVDLSAFAGQSIQIRWRFGSDAGTVREGWYVDNVRITAPQVANPDPVVPTGLTIRKLSNGDIFLSWNADGNSYYRVYSSSNSNGPFDTFVGSSTTTSLTFTPGVSDMKMFYVVVGWDGN